MRFIAAATYTLDSKARIALPAVYRNECYEGAQGKFVLTVGDECLLVYSVTEWERILEEETSPALLGMDEMMFARYERFLDKYTETVNTDPQGRIHIPQVLLEFAKLGREVLITSKRNGLEIWNQAEHDKFIGPVEDFKAAYRRRLFNKRPRPSDDKPTVTQDTSDSSANRVDED